jgi:tetratricopeptide (TPR) repeat protein
VRRALVLSLAWLGLVAATPRPFMPPPPDLAPLVPFVAAPLDKPPVLAEAPLPPAPMELPPLPLAALTVPASEKPAAFPHSPRTLACIGAWTGVPSESLECGRARYQRGEFEEAARALESAARPGAERDILREARYWLGETYYRLSRIEEADWLFRQVATDSPRAEFGVWAQHSSGWTALRVGDAARARDAFTAVLSGPVPSSIEAWARHGLGLAHYALGRHQEAEQAWALALQRGTPVMLGRDILFWHGEALGRIGEPGRAEADLKRFVDGGAHALIPTAQLRLAWWALAAKHAPEAVAAFRAYLSHPVSLTGKEREWGEAGLALALLTTGDWSGARDAAAALSTRRSSLALPLQLRLLRTALDSPANAEVDPIVQDLLAANLAPAVRGWVLLVKGEIDRAKGNRDEARTQFDLARQVSANTPIAWQASFRLARTNFELREFKQALAELAPLASPALPPDLRIAVLIEQGEAAYQTGDYMVAAAAFRRALLEFPAASESPMIRLAIAWTSLRQGRSDVARREFLDFARVAPDHAYAIDALVIAAELAVAAGDLEGGRALLDRIVQTYPTHPRTDFARLNRGILMVRAGDAAGAKTALNDWLGRAPFPALFGRAHAALAAAALATGDLPAVQRSLALARREGLTAFSSLGTGALALRQRQWDDAARAFTEARDAGTPDVVAAAEYGLAVASFQKGAAREFAKPAQTALAALPSGPASADRAGELLYALTGIAVNCREWSGALSTARRLATEYPSHDAADDALERVAAAAAGAKAWPIAYEADSLLRQRYPQSPFVAQGRVRVAEALFETGRVDEARKEIEKAVVDAPNDPKATMILARVREATGDRSGALEAYSRAARDGSGPEWSTPALFGHARLLTQEKRWDQARGVLERLLKSDETTVASEAAQAIGDTYTGEGDALAAAEYYLTAAYVAPASTQGRRALLAAARAFAELKQNDAAELAYKKLLAQADLPADIAAAARQGLSSLGR